MKHLLLIPFASVALIFLAIQLDGQTSMVRTGQANTIPTGGSVVTSGTGSVLATGHTSAKDSATAPAVGFTISDSTGFAGAAGGGGAIIFKGNYTGSVSTVAGAIHAYKTNATDSDFGFDLAFNTRDNGGTNTEKLHIVSGTGNLLATGLFGKYNNINTSGWGIPAIYGSGRFTAQTAAKTTVATYTVGASDGSFIVSANILVTASTTHSFTTTVSYTDEGNTARVLTLNFSQLTGTLLTAITNVQGVGAYEGVPLHIRCKAATTITIGTTGTFTTVTYNAEGYITQIG
jgi:hypothetical protein